MFNQYTTIDISSCKEQVVIQLGVGPPYVGWQNK